jgi:hypothetical protein
MESAIATERLGRTELLFREVNERIREIAGRFGVLDVALFICECGQGSCAESIELSLEEYDALRSLPGAFAMVPGHEAAHERVVARKRHYEVVLGVGQGDAFLPEPDA